MSSSTETRSSIDHGLSLGQLCHALWRHKLKGLGTFLLILALVFAALLVWPKKFRSEAGIFVRVGRESVTLDPTATTGPTLNVLDSRENELNSVVSMLQSRAVIEAAVDQVGVDKLLDRAQGSQPQDEGLAARASVVCHSILDRVRSWMTEIGLRPQVDDRQRAIERVESSLSVSATRKSSVIQVAAKAGSPELAQAIVTAVLDVYQNTHLRANRTEGSFCFFDEQAAQLDSRLQSAETQLEEAKNEGGVTTLKARQETLQSEIGQIEISLMSSRAELAAATARIASRKTSLDGQAPTVMTEQTSGFGNEAADRMYEKLYELRIREQELRSKYSADHPLVKAVQEQVKESQAIVERQAASRTQSTTGLNPNRQALELDLANEQALVAAARSRIEALEQQHTASLARLRELNHHELQITRLEREVEQLSTSYRKYIDSREVARIDQELESRRISNINVFQPAAYVSRPASPRPWIVLALGMFVAVFGAVTVPVLCEARDHTLRNPEDIERTLEVPVLVSIPRGTRQRVPLN